MAWVNRPSGRYYYRNRRIGGRVVTEYVGTGLPAEVAAAQDAANRRRREMAAAERQAAVDGERRQDEALARVDDLVKAAVSAVLIAAGYHQHKRQWRKTKR